MARKITYIAICPQTGLHLREATPEEVETYHTRQPDPRYRRGSICWSTNIPLGEVTIVGDTGPGEWYGGAGF